MNRFLQRHASRVMGVLSGFDRLVFRGTLMQLAYSNGLGRFLSRRRVLLKDFKQFAGEMTERVKEASRRRADQAGRPVRYLGSSKICKEDVARKIARDDGVTEGLIAVLTCVEPCTTFEIHRNRERKHLQLRSHHGKCLHLYHYGIDPLFGFMSARIQTWFPFSFQICINGREWLGRELYRAGIQYLKVDNCFPWIQDLERAQEILDEQLRTSEV